MYRCDVSTGDRRRKGVFQPTTERVKLCQQNTSLNVCLGDGHAVVSRLASQDGRPNRGTDLCPYVGLLAPLGLCVGHGDPDAEADERVCLHPS